MHAAFTFKTTIIIPRKEALLINDLLGEAKERRK